MGLTRPKIWDLDTNIEYFTDPMLVLHTGPVTTANVDVGIVFNRAHGLVPNVAWYWSETLQSMVAALTPTGNTYVSQYTYSNVSVSSYANVTIGNIIANTAVYSPAYFYANGTPFVSSNYGNTQVLANLASTGNPITIGSNLTVNGNLTVVGNITSVNYDTINYTETANVLNANVLTVSGVNIISNVSSLQNQITGANTNISAIQANIGSYYTYANANVSSLQNQITGANTNISVIQANIGAYELYSNANVGSIFNTVTTHTTWLGNLQANVYANANVVAYLGNNPITVGGNLIANSGVTSTSTTTGALQVAGGVGVSGNTYTGSLYTTNGLFWAGNGKVISTGGSTTISINNSIYSNTANATTSTTLIDTYPVSGNTFVRWILTSIDNVNKNYAACTIDSLNDGANVYYTEYADIKSNVSSSVATFISNISSGNINLYAVGASPNVTISSERILLGSNTPIGYLNQNVTPNPSVYQGQSVVGTVATLVDTLPISGNTFVRWITTSKDYINNNYRSSTVDTINDGTNVYYAEIAVLKTKATANVTVFTSNISSGNINLYAVGDSSIVNVSFERVVLGSSTTAGYLTNSSGSQNLTDYVGKTSVTTSPTLVDSVAVLGNTLVRWTLVNKDNTNSYYSSSTIDAITDGGNVYYAEYDVIRSINSQPVSTFTSNVTNGNITLWATGSSTSVTTSFQRTILGNSTVSAYSYSNTPTTVIWNGGIVTGQIETTGAILVTNATQSTGNSTGALVVTGGVGIGGNTNIGGNATIGGNTTIGGNIVATGNVYSAAYFYSNGSPFLSSSYGNVQMLANLATSGNPVTFGSNIAVSGNITTAGISINGVGLLTSTEVYDLDDISNYTDGLTNTFRPTYNGSAVTVTNAWNLDIFVNGVNQPAFKYNSDLVWGGYALTASKGYCIDYSGNVRFADALPATSQVSITTKLGTNTQTTKTYPFKPLDIMLGS